MKERKGFTLIELLAVIVILAIIALIATPIIMGVIEDARKGAHKDAALGFGKAVETAIATQMIKCPNMTVSKVNVDTITIADCTVDGSEVTSLSINYQGTKPDSGEDKMGVSYDSSTGKVTGTVTFSGQKYSVVTGEEVK